MGMLRAVLVMCSFSFFNEAKKIYIPPISRTLGKNKWYIHYNEMCPFDAQKHCEQLYTNGRLLMLESNGVIDMFNEKFNNLTEIRAIAFIVGLHGSGNQTHNEFKWPNCDSLDSSIGAWISSEPNLRCFRYFVSMGAWLIDGGNNDRYGHFFHRNCSLSSAYICEEMTTEQCDMEEILNADVGLIVNMTEAGCDAICQHQPNCWGTLFIFSFCLLMKNTADGVNTNFIMKSKNCFEDLIVTSVANITQTCQVTSSECSAQPFNYQTPEMTPGIITSTYQTLSTMDLNTPPPNYITVHLTETVTLTDYITLPLIATFTVTQEIPVANTPVTNCTTNELTETITITQLAANRSEICTPIVNYTTKELGEKIDKIVRELKVNKSKTSATLRSLACAKDDRPSAQTVGVFGMFIIVVPFALLFITDIPKIIAEIRGK